MTRILGFLLRRRLLRVLPGGWLGFLVASPTARRLALNGFRALRRRRASRRLPDR